MTKYTTLFLALILLVAIILRFYQLGSVPIGLTWDEVSVGYDAWAVGHYGMDQWGHHFPLVFTSFEDDKHPVHIYATALFELIFGLNEFGTRFGAAFFGVLNVFLLYLLSYLLTRQRLVSLLAAFVLAISPYDIQFSRWEHELNYALFFFLLGCCAFFKGLEKGKWWLVVAFVSWGIDLLTYHSVEVVFPPVLFYLILMYHKKLLEHKKYFLSGLFVLTLFVGVIVTNPALLGTARINQTGYSDQEMLKLSSLYKTTGSYWLGRLDIMSQQYLSHLSQQFLFISGDKNPRHSDQLTGQFYWLDLPFLLIGLISLVLKRKSWAYFILLWFLIAPVPASLVKEVPHAARALFMVGSWHIVIAVGLSTVIMWFKNNSVRCGVVTVMTVVYLVLCAQFFVKYLPSSAEQYPHEWQDGMKEMATYIGTNPNFIHAYITEERVQPYIFFLYYLQIPPADFQKSVVYNQNKHRSSNLVSSFDKYQFGDWDIVKSPLEYGTVYAVTPSEYSGLQHQDAFHVNRKIVHPNGSEAFYIVSIN